MSLRLALIYGGPGGEHAVSCRSAASMLKHLDGNRYEVTLIGISPEGRWFLQPPLAAPSAPDVLPLSQDETQELWIRPGRGLAGAQGPLPLDAALLAVHGTRGEDGCLQGLLEWAGLAYTGPGVLGSALGMDKAKAKEVWLQAGLPAVPFRVVRPEDAQRLGLNRLADEIEGAYHWPVFVKPANSGSSVGVSRVTAAKDLGPALEAAWAVDSKAMVEPAVKAREIEVAVLAGEVYGPGEIVTQHHAFYDYDAKYLDPDGARLLIPADLNEDQTHLVRSLALAAAQACEATRCSRVDFFLDQDSGRFLLNEINTLPGFTSISMFPRMVMAGGLSYAEVLDRLIAAALRT